MIVAELLEWVERASPDLRAEAARAMGCALLLAPEGSAGHAAMQAAITVLLDTSSADIREAVADALGASDRAPSHVIAALAADQAAIAAHVVARSPLFLDAELIGLLSGAPASLQIAVASRPAISPAVAASIIETCDRQAWLTLLANQGAAISEATFARLAERSADDPSIREAMLARADLPAAVHQGLVKHVADRLRTLVVERAWMGELRAAQVMREATERATVAIAAACEPEPLAALVEHLRVSGQLTTALILRAACAGYLDFFEMAVAALADVPVDRVANLVRARRGRGLRAIYARAGLPELAFDAFAAAVDTWGRIAAAAEGEGADYYESSAAVTDAVLARYAATADGEGSDVATMLRRFAAEQAREAAHEYARLSAA